jgi:DNA-binding MarR family transcriptional regulator
MGSDLSITPGDKRIIQSLLLGLEPVSNMRSHPVKLRLVTAFLAVASNEGKGLSEYARCLGIHRATISRFIYELADRSRYGGPGLGLISIYKVSGRPNRQEIILTKKGRAIAMAMLRRLPSPQTEQTPVA